MMYEYLDVSFLRAPNNRKLRKFQASAEHHRWLSPYICAEYAWSAASGPGGHFVGRGLCLGRN